MTVIVMTREMGTLGKEVAREFGRRKGYSVLHHELVPSVDERSSKAGESEVYRFLEGSQEELDKWRGNREGDGYLTPQEAIELALEGNVLIRGWGAARLLRSVPGVLSVRVCAPMERRIEEMKSRLGVDDGVARREIERSDAAHTRTFMRFFQNDWRDPVNYDLVMNTEHVDAHTCADILIDAVENPAFAETAEMRTALSDMLMEQQIRAALHDDPALARRGRQIEVQVENTLVRLYGVVSDGNSRALAERIVTDGFGQPEVQNEIARVGRFSD